MFRMEFHAADGGVDAEMFANELATSVSKFAGLTMAKEGRVIVATAHRL